jgi:DNA-binding NarL/FixJ family response regulator
MQLKPLESWHSPCWLGKSDSFLARGRGHDPMPRLDGREATRRIKREWPDTKVLVLTHRTDDDTRREAFEKGADAFLNKRDIASGLVPAIWDACGAERPRPASARRR